MAAALTAAQAQPKGGLSPTVSGPVPQPGGSVSANLTTICQGGTAVLTASASSASSPQVACTWSPNQAISATSGVQVVVNPLQTTTYTVVILADGQATTRSITITVLSNCCQQAVVPSANIVELDPYYAYNTSKPKNGDPFTGPAGTYYHVAGASLTLYNNDVTLPPGSVLLMDPDAVLILDDTRLHFDGATITAACDQQWGGVKHDGNGHGIFAAAVGTLHPRILHSRQGIVFIKPAASVLSLSQVDFLHNDESISLNCTQPATSSDQISQCLFDSDPALMKIPYQPQGADTWVSQRHVSVLGNAGNLQFTGNTLQHALLGVELLPGTAPALSIVGGQFAEVYLAGVVSRDNTTYGGAQLTVTGTRFTFPLGNALPATSQVTQTLPVYSQVLRANETVGLAPLLVPTTVTGGCRFEQPDPSPYPTFQYEKFRPRQIGVASQALGPVLDNTFTGLAVGIAHGLRNGATNTEVRGNLFTACEKGYNLVPFDSYTHPQPTGTAYVSCNTFARGIGASGRGGVSYGIYQEADANVTLANPNPNNGGLLLKNRFDDFGAGSSGFYALYNANSSVMLNYETYDDYRITAVQPLSNALVTLTSHSNPVYYPNNGSDCAPLGPNGLPRPAAGASAAAPLPLVYLEQNVPNPATGTTRIAYHLPADTRKVALVVRRAMDGQLLTSVPVSLKSSYYDLPLASYAAGTYFYSLLVNGQPVATRRLVVQ